MVTLQRVGREVEMHWHLCLTLCSTSAVLKHAVVGAHAASLKSCSGLVLFWFFHANPAVSTVFLTFACPNLWIAKGLVGPLGLAIPSPSKGKVQIGHSS